MRSTRQNRGSCWLIANPAGRLPLAAGAIARFLAMRVESCPVSAGIAPISSDPSALIAMSFSRLEQLGADDMLRLHGHIQRGATLYVRGEFYPDQSCSLAPFSQSRFRITAQSTATGCRFLNHPALPSALRGERSDVEFAVLGACGLDADAQPIVLARYPGGEHPCIFALRCGEGMVLYDLHPDDSLPQHPIPILMEHQETRNAIIGALVAANRASGHDAGVAAAVDLVIDDRPANLDYFNSSRLEAMLAHFESRCPGVHVDWAWTPNQTWASRSYVDVLKSRHAGFVWHGFLRHVDHRGIPDPLADLRAGRRLVEQISRRYEVRFQPVMVFPFEKDDPQKIQVIKDEGFIAKAEIPDQTITDDRLKAAQNGDRACFTVLRRYPVQALTRERMLALATLGLPVIAAAHPGDLSIRRLANFRPSGGSFSHFDSVLQFAAAKSLRPRSLEEIAAEIIASPIAGEGSAQ